MKASEAYSVGRGSDSDLASSKQENSPPPVALSKDEGWTHETVGKLLFRNDGEFPDLDDLQEVADAVNASLASQRKQFAETIRRLLAINDELWAEESVEWRQNLYFEAHELAKGKLEELGEKDAREQR